MNRANGYERESVAYELKEDAADYGLRQAPSFSAKYIYTKARAVKIAEMLARKSKYERNRYTFQLPWTFCRLEVGDLVTITEPNSFLDKTVVRITGVTEKENGLLMFKAVGTPPGDYDPAQYDVHENDRPYINMNDTASDTIPVMFQPPADMTRDGLELWIAAKGKEKNWGGCSVYLSDDNEHYIHAGDINNSSRLGEVKSYSADTLLVSCNGQLLSGKPEDAERGNTLCWVGGECLSYTTAILQSDGTYLLEGLVRGQYNTVKAKHSAGEPFVRLDNYLLKIPFAKNDIGKKIYLKFISKNIFGAGEQDLSDVKAYEYALQKYYIPPVTNITAHNRYRQLADGVSRYDIVVKWIPPELQSYLQGDVWYKTSNEQSLSVGKMADVPVSEIGFQGDWTYGGSGKNQVVIPQAVVGDTYLIAVCTKDTFGESTSPDSSPQIKILVALKTEMPNTPDGFTIEFGATATASWQEVTNTDIAFYEIRRDSNAGEESENLLARTNNLSAILPLTQRTGKLFLFARSAIGKYSAPAELTYNKTVPPKPKPPKLKSSVRGFGITAEPIPSGAVGMAIYIDGTGDLQTVKTANNSYFYSCEAGIYDVTIAFYDIFGEGEQSESSRVTIKATIPNDWIDKEKLGLTRLENEVGKIDERIASGAEQFYESRIKGDVESYIVQLNDIITQNVNNKLAGVNSRITQLDDTINLRVTKQLDGKADKANLISQINICPETITVDGKFVHVTGDTLFDNNVIVNRMLSAKSITADKIAAESITTEKIKSGAVTTDKMTIGSAEGARMALKPDLLEIFDENNFRVIALGVLRE